MQIQMANGDTGFHRPSAPAFRGVPAFLTRNSLAVVEGPPRPAAGPRRSGSLRSDRRSRSLYHPFILHSSHSFYFTIMASAMCTVEKTSSGREYKVKDINEADFGMFFALFPCCAFVCAFAFV